MSGERDDDFGIGDVVQHKMNPDVFGMVIGFAGSVVSVRLCPTLAVVMYHDFELEFVPEFTSADGAAAQNVIRVDFTKKRKLEDIEPSGTA